MDKKIIITAALTGVATTRKHCPYIPYTPEEISEEAYRAYNAGASVVHIHARENDGTPTHRLEVYNEILNKTKEKCPVIINFSTGAIGIPVEERISHVRDIKPDIGALNMGSMNYAKFSEKDNKFHFDFIFSNPFKDIIKFLEAMNSNGVKPELECFDSGHINNSEPLIKMGVLKKPVQFSLILGVLGGISPTTQNLCHMVSLLPSDSTWEVIGISHLQWSLIAAALSLGGNIRVGLEDHFYLSEGVMAKSNGELVEKAARMTEDVGLKVASVEEARKILCL